MLSTRPIYHKCDETIRGHVFCSFLSLLLIKDLQERMEQRGWGEVEWDHLIEDIEEVKEIRIETAILGEQSYDPEIFGYRADNRVVVSAVNEK